MVLIRRRDWQLSPDS